jgi:hypothetical protein
MTMPARPMRGRCLPEVAAPPIPSFLKLPPFVAHLLKVIFDPFLTFFEGLLRGRELAFGWDQKNQPAD